MGGTSAGMAILGPIMFDAQYASVTSSDALADPLQRNITLVDDMLQVTSYGGPFICDMHFVTRDRMGRLVAFMVNAWKGHSWGPLVRGLACDEHTALLLDTKTGMAQVVGTSTAYALTYNPKIGPTALKPLSWQQVDVIRLSVMDLFDFAHWVPLNAHQQWYQLRVTKGVLSAIGNNGSIY